MTHRRTAALVGSLFITATVSFSLSVIVLDPVLGAADFLNQVSVRSSRVSAGVLLEMVNHIAVVGIAVAIYPVLGPFSSRVAVGYVAVRSIEATLFALATMHLLTLVMVGQAFVVAGSPSGSYMHTLGELLRAGHDWNHAALAFMAFSLGALMLNYALFRTRLVPRWISAFGLLAAASILLARLMLLGGLELPPSVVTVMDGPIFLQEMVFAGWLIFRGFDESALAAGSTRSVASLG